MLFPLSSLSVWPERAVQFSEPRALTFLCLGFLCSCPGAAGLLAEGQDRDRGGRQKFLAQELADKVLEMKWVQSTPGSIFRATEGPCWSYNISKYKELSPRFFPSPSRMPVDMCKGRLKWCCWFGFFSLLSPVMQWLWMRGHCTRDRGIGVPWVGALGFCQLRWSFNDIKWNMNS